MAEKQPFCVWSEKTPSLCAVLAEGCFGEDAELLFDVVLGVVGLFEQPPFDERDYAAGEKLGKDIRRDLTRAGPGFRLAEASHDVVGEDLVHFVEHERAVRLEYDGAQAFSVLREERYAEGHDLVVVGDEIVLAVRLFDLLMQPVHDVADALVKQLVLVLEMGVERAAVDERAVADVDDRDGSERLLVEELVECVHDRFLRTLDAQIGFIRIFSHKALRQLMCFIFRKSAALSVAAKGDAALRDTARAAIAARSTDSTSLAMYGTDTASADAPRGLPVTSAYCPIPIMWHTASPASASIAEERRRRSAPPVPTSATRGKNPHMNPPVTPISLYAPPVNPANTGAPHAPSATYTPIAASPYFHPRKKPVKATANVWRVSGTPDGRGMLICDKTAVKAAKSAT